MGNLMETCIQKPKGEPKNDDLLDGKQQNPEEVEKETRSHRRVKIILTKMELEWLTYQLKKREGKGIEEVLEEIERGRERSSVGWKPSLESIVECPEMQEMDR